MATLISRFHTIVEICAEPSGSVQDLLLVLSITEEVWPMPDTQRDCFCPGTWFGFQKCRDNLFEQISKIKGYNSKVHGVSGVKIVKLVFI